MTTPKAIELLTGERQPGETRMAVQACNDYLRLGPLRSFPKLMEQYQRRSKDAKTTAISSLKRWSALYGWGVRAEEHDNQIEREKNIRMAEERREIMEEGIGLDYKRVAELKKLHKLLTDELYTVELVGDDETSDDDGTPDGEISRLVLVGDDYDEADLPTEGKKVRRPNLWLRTRKAIKTGEETYETVTEVRMNAPLIEQVRGVLDDVAKEKGERKLRVESSSIAVNISAEDMSAAQTELQKWSQQHAAEIPPMPVQDEPE